MDHTGSVVSVASLCAACLLFGLPAPGTAADAELPTKRLELYRTALPPQLDGRRDAGVPPADVIRGAPFYG